MLETAFPQKLAQAIESIDQNSKQEESLLDKTKSKFQKSRLYGIDKSNFGFISGAYSLVETIVLLLFGYMPYMWQLSGQILQQFGWQSSSEIYQALLFTTLTSIKDIVISLPFELYSTFVIEERHGFNKQTLMLFVTDKIKGILLSIVIGYPILAALIFLIQWGGDNFVVYVWGFLLCFTIVMMTIYPVLIMPLFNKFTPLDEGALRTRIESLAAGLNFPLAKLFVCDGSKRSSHSNAYFYGFMNSKRIVLFDTLLGQATNDEIVAILGHELGHWKMWHTAQGFLIQQLYMLGAFYVFSK